MSLTTDDSSAQVVMFERGGRCWRQGPETKKAAQGCWRDARYGGMWSVYVGSAPKCFAEPKNKKSSLRC